MKRPLSYFAPKPNSRREYVIIILILCLIITFASVQLYLNYSAPKWIVSGPAAQAYKRWEAYDRYDKDVSQIVADNTNHSDDLRKRLFQKVQSARNAAIIPFDTHAWPSEGERQLAMLILTEGNPSAAEAEFLQYLKASYPNYDADEMAKLSIFIAKEQKK